MMSTSVTERDIVLKVWDETPDDVTIIKEVATKGKYIEMCWDYLSRRRNVTKEESRKYFDVQVDVYVCRLLRDRLLFKAEIVLQNVKRSVKCVYYQFAFDSDDPAIKEAIFSHLKKKDQSKFYNDRKEFEFYWTVLSEIRKCDNLAKAVVKDMGVLNLEILYKQKDIYRNQLVVRTYFVTKNSYFIERIDKTEVWKYLIEEKRFVQLIKWIEGSDPTEKDENLIELYEKFKKWNITKEMFEFAIKTYQNPSEILRNSLVSAGGYLFSDEEGNVQKILERYFTVEKDFDFGLSKNQNLLLSKYLLKEKLYELLLEEFVTLESVEKLESSEEFPTELLNVIKTFKKQSNLLNDKQSFIECNSSISNYLKSNVKDFNETSQNVQLVNLLLSNFDIRMLHANPDFDRISKTLYISSILRRCHETELKCNLTSEQLLLKYKKIDLNLIVKEAGGQKISFCNEMLSQKYSQKFKLNYLFYLKQQRSAYAVYNLLVEQLHGYSQISKAQLFNVTEVATELSVANFQNQELITHCIAFIEMLGFDTKKLRSYLRLMRLVYGLTNTQNIEVQRQGYSYLINTAESLLFSSNLDAKTDAFPLLDYTAVWAIAKTSNNLMPEMHLQALATANNWWKLLILSQHFEFELSQLKRLLPHFGNQKVGGNFLRALCCEVTSEKSRRRTSFSRAEIKQRKAKRRSDIYNYSTATASGETMTSSISSTAETQSIFKQSANSTNSTQKYFQESNELDLFAIIILSTNSMPDEKIELYQKMVEILSDATAYSTSINLLKNSIRHNLPILSVLSAVTFNENLEWCWAIWLTSSIQNNHIDKTFKRFDDYALNLIEKSILYGYVKTLDKSFRIFYMDCQFGLLTNFLVQSVMHEFTESAVSQLQLYLLAISNNDVILPFMTEPFFSKDDYLIFTTKLLLSHLQNNLKSLHHQQLFVETICQSGISDISYCIDFCTLRKIFEITAFTKVRIQLENLRVDVADTTTYRRCEEYVRVCKRLQEEKLFDKAVELAKLLNLSTDAIIYDKWFHKYETDESNFDFELCELETEELSLQPDLLISFYLRIATKLVDGSKEKYDMLKRVLSVIKKHRLFPNECFDRDRIEYDMILCYLKSNLNLEQFDIYYSEYFEEILRNERCVLYKSFLELKELAGIDDLSITETHELSGAEKMKLEQLLHKLLDEGDIVEALRLQAIFDYRPIDLHFLVFSMALAEGLTSIYNLTQNERSILTDLVRGGIAKFNRRTLGTGRSASVSSSPSKLNESSDANSTSDFEEIPSREKQDILEALQGIASRLTHGINIGKRILMTYRASMYLDKDYIDILKTKDPISLVRYAITEDCLQKLMIINDIFTSTQMCPAEISDFLSVEIATAIIRPRFYIFKTDNSLTGSFHMPGPNILWGYDLDKEFHYFLELSTNTTLLGNKLLDICDALKIYRKFQDNKNHEIELEENPQIVQAFENLKEIIREYGLPNDRHNMNQVLSHKKQNIINVELLIKAHDCFVHECSMEGISNVLSRAKTLNAILSSAKSWNLIVRLTTGIGRYREMYYCFESLIENEQFESLLGQFDEIKTNGLRHAIVSHVIENCPENSEYLRLAALHFRMYKELAEMCETEGNSKLSKILLEYKIFETNSTISTKSIDENKNCSGILNCSLILLTELNQVLNIYTQATENYLFDNKLRLAQKIASHAELLAMQIDLVNKGLSATSSTCVCVLDVKSIECFKQLVNNELSVPQSQILERSYVKYEINWIEAILNQFIVIGRESYIKEFCDRMELTDLLVENIVKSFQTLVKPTNRMEQSMYQLVDMVQSVTIKYKLSSILGFKQIITKLINEQSLYYLKDTNYGRNDMHKSIYP